MEALGLIVNLLALFAFAGLAARELQSNGGA